jgi:hypothetical protein
MFWSKQSSGWYWCLPNQIALIHQQRLDPLPRQVQVVPAALGLESLQLEGEPAEVEKGRAAGRSAVASG